MGLRRFFSFFSVALSFFPIAASFHLPVRIRRAVVVLDDTRIENCMRRCGDLAENSRRMYDGTLKRLNKWLGDEGRSLDDAALASYIGRLDDRGLAIATPEMVRKAVRRYCKVEGLLCPVGPLTKAALKQYGRESVRRGRGRAEALLADDARAILDSAAQSREYADGRRESTERARRRGLLDSALVAVLFLGGLRVSEAAKLSWADVIDAADGRSLVIHVRQSKTDPDGSETDVRFVNGRKADALRALRREVEGHRHPDRGVFGGLTGPTLSRHLTRAAEAAGIGKRITGHSGRIGLAEELTRRGASTHEVMLAGNWKSPQMVAHYSAAARAESGAVARLMERDSGEMSVEQSCPRLATGLPSGKSAGRVRFP